MMIRVGICSWTEKTLVQSNEFYPEEVTTAEARLRYYASHFDVVEVDSTYYAIPTMQTVARWAERTPEDFVFHIKVYGSLTGHGVDPRSLPRDIQDMVNNRDREGKKVYIKDPSMLRDLADRFKESLHPLVFHRKIGLIVFQYPPWFPYGHRNMDSILDVKKLMAPLAVAIEFRNGSWLTPDKRGSVMKFLKENGLIYVIADEPQFGGFKTVPFLPDVTGAISYFRFHGRNRENWFKKGVETSLRFAYQYSENELKEFIPSIREAASKAQVTYLMFNNCYKTSAIRNAQMTRKLLKENDVNYVSSLAAPKNME